MKEDTPQTKYGMWSKVTFSWKKMRSRSYVAKSQKTAGGFKVAKDRVLFKSFRRIYVKTTSSKTCFKATFVKGMTDKKTIFTE